MTWTGPLSTWPWRATRASAWVPPPRHSLQETAGWMESTENLDTTNRTNHTGDMYSINIIYIVLCDLNTTCNYSVVSELLATCILMIYIYIYDTISPFWIRVTTWSAPRLQSQVWSAVQYQDTRQCDQHHALADQMTPFKKKHVLFAFKFWPWWLMISNCFEVLHDFRPSN